MHRFLLGKDFCSATGLNLEPGCRCGYDLVMSDGQRRIKALLSPSHNHLVERGHVTELSILAVHAATMRVDETRLGAPPFCILHQAEVVAVDLPPTACILRHGVEKLMDWGNLTCTPSPGSPPMYVDLHVNTFEVDQYPPPATRSELLADDPSALLAAAQPLGETDYRTNLSEQVLVGRIVKKSQAMCFSGVLDTQSPLPFKVYLDIDDGSGLACVVLWYGMASKLFVPLQVRIVRLA